jgi:hypothetical protein
MLTQYGSIAWPERAAVAGLRRSVSIEMLAANRRNDREFTQFRAHGWDREMPFDRLKSA